jgi:hypothetical protein
MLAAGASIRAGRSNNPKGAPFARVNDQLLVRYEGLPHLPTRIERAAPKNAMYRASKMEWRTRAAARLHIYEPAPHVVEVVK